VTDETKLARIEELFQRTTQFNTTGRKFTVGELSGLLKNPAAHLYMLHVSDRFGDHGLTGAAVIVNGDISGLVMSCRVLGLGIEHQFMQHIIAEVKQPLTAKIIDTPRNIPVRNIYKDNGFTEIEPGLWRL
jgi:FkbH-like protein